VGAGRISDVIKKYRGKEDFMEPASGESEVKLKTIKLET